jgi:hypothetical protein
MTHLITQEQRGLTNGCEDLSQANKDDQGLSMTWARAKQTTLSLTGHTPHIAKNNDHIVIGYGEQGLPFQLAIRHNPACDVTENQMFTVRHIIPMIVSYQRKLCGVENSYPLMAQLLDDIRELQAKSASQSRFSLAVAITYPNHDKIKLTGFSIGKTAVELRRADGRLTTLGYRNLVNDDYDQLEAVPPSATENTGPDNVPAVSASARADGVTISNRSDKLIPTSSPTPSPSSPRATKIQPITANKLLERNSYFQTDLQVGDEVVTYSELPWTIQTITRIKSDKVRTLRYGLDETYFDLHLPLLKQIRDIAMKKYAELLTQSARSLREDDTMNFVEQPMVGSMTIPSIDLQNDIKSKILNRTILALHEYSLYYTSASIRESICKVVRSIERITKESNPDYAELIAVVAQIHFTCLNPSIENCKTLQARGKTLQGHSSYAWKTVGIGLMALGVLILASGVLLGIWSCGTGTLGATLIASGGMALALSGYGIFTAGCQHGLAKQVDRISTDTTLTTPKSIFVTP